jgi:hypothetical protein
MPNFLWLERAWQRCELPMDGIQDDGTELADLVTACRTLQAARRLSVIEGRAIRGGNTHQQPSSCRKKKIACEPFGADTSTCT